MQAARSPIPPTAPLGRYGSSRLQITYAALAALQLALVVLYGTGRGVRVHTTLASAIVNLVTTLVLLVLSDLEHVRSIRPSFLLQIFFTAIVLVDLPRIRTQWLLNNNSVVAAVFSITFALNVALLTVESLQKWKHSTLYPSNVSPEDYQGVFGRTFFTWLNPLFMEGYQRDLTMDDLCVVDNELKGETFYARLLRHWNTGMASLPQVEASFEKRSADNQPANHGNLYPIS